MQYIESKAKCENCDEFKCDNDICQVCPDTELYPELKNKYLCLECCSCNMLLPTKAQIEYMIAYGLD